MEACNCVVVVRGVWEEDIGAGKKATEVRDGRKCERKWERKDSPEWHKRSPNPNGLPQQKDTSHRSDLEQDCSLSADEES